MRRSEDYISITYIIEWPGSMVQQLSLRWTGDRWVVDFMFRVGSSPGRKETWSAFTADEEDGRQRLARFVDRQRNDEILGRPDRIISIDIRGQRS